MPGSRSAAELFENDVKICIYSHSAVPRKRSGKNDNLGGPMYEKGKTLSVI